MKEQTNKKKASRFFSEKKPLHCFFRLYPRRGLFAQYQKYMLRRSRRCGQPLHAFCACCAMRKIPGKVTLALLSTRYQVSAQHRNGALCGGVSSQGLLPILEESQLFCESRILRICERCANRYTQHIPGLKEVHPSRTAVPFCGQTASLIPSN